MLYYCMQVRWSEVHPKLKKLCSGFAQTHIYDKVLPQITSISMTKLGTCIIWVSLLQDCVCISEFYFLCNN